MEWNETVGLGPKAYQPYDLLIYICIYVKMAMMSMNSYKTYK